MGCDPYESCFRRNSWKIFEERYVRKDDLSKNRDFKMNWSGLDVFMEHWVDLGINTWKNGRKIHIMGIFR